MITAMGKEETHGAERVEVRMIKVGVDPTIKAPLARGHMVAMAKGIVTKEEVMGEILAMVVVAMVVVAMAVVAMAVVAMAVVAMVVVAMAVVAVVAMAVVAIMEGAVATEVAMDPALKRQVMEEVKVAQAMMEQDMATGKRNQATKKVTGEAVTVEVVFTVLTLTLTLTRDVWPW